MSLLAGPCLDPPPWPLPAEGGSAVIEKQQAEPTLSSERSLSISSSLTQVFPLVLFVLSQTLPFVLFISRLFSLATCFVLELCIGPVQ